MASFLVIVPTFNSGQHIESAIASLVYQSGPFDLHIHVQDGGSTDNTLEIVSAWQQRVKAPHRLTCESDTDNGLYDAIDRGAKQLQPHQIMTWLGSDDVLIVGALATVASVFDQLEQVDWVTGLPFVSAPGVGNFTPYPPQNFVRHHIAAGRHDGRSLGFIMQEGTFWRASLWQKVGGIDTKFSLAGDWDLWRRFAQHAPLYQVAFPLGRFTRRPGQKSQDMESYYREVDNSPILPAIPDHLTHELRRYPWGEEWQIVTTNTAPVAEPEPVIEPEIIPEPEPVPGPIIEDEPAPPPQPVISSVQSSSYWWTKLSWRSKFQS